MTLSVKNMVCERCLKVVRDILAVLGVKGAEVGMGYIRLPGTLPEGVLQALGRELLNEGFEIIHSRDESVVEQAKNLLIKQARAEGGKPVKLSVYLSEALKMDYSAISRLFSAIEGRTIERYYILQKIEYVKELIDYGRNTLSEIADRAGYSSVAHLSRQFKDVTGLTTTAYKESGLRHRPLDKV